MQDANVLHLMGTWRAGIKSACLRRLRATAIHLGRTTDSAVCMDHLTENSNFTREDNLSVYL